jgi:hypothetical protein
VLTERSIRFELVLVEKLIGGRLMRKLRVAVAILLDCDAFSEQGHNLVRGETGDSDGGIEVRDIVLNAAGVLTWKQGDLGVNIITREGKHLDNPNSGVILRANPDGTDAEIFASGLRNPQEFAFDEYGNLISPDNDGDHAGETERLLYVVDGMDSGWRINWQFGKYVDPDNNTYKVWMKEGLFMPRFAA